MAPTPKITGLRKRQAIDKAAQSMLLWVVAASLMVSILIVSSQFFYSQFMYNNKVIGAKNKAAGTLADNVENIEELKESFKPLEAGAIPNVNPDKVLSALPAELATSAFGTSLEKVFAPQSGVTLTSVQIQASSNEGGDLLADSLVTSDSSEASVPTPISATIVAAGSYEQIATFVKNLERSIRPIQVDTFDIRGTSTNLQATIELTTYYQPAKKFTIVEEELKR